MENENERRAKLGSFFNEYAKRFTDAFEGKPYDVDGVSGSFTASFIESSPVGIMAGKNDDRFREMIPKGYEYYKSIGSKGITIVSKEITLLDEFHSMVKVHWKTTYDKKDGSEVSIEFDTFYMVSEKEGKPRIFAYITGDEEKAIKEAGLEPYK